MNISPRASVQGGDAHSRESQDLLTEQTVIETWPTRAITATRCSDSPSSRAESPHGFLSFSGPVLVDGKVAGTSSGALLHVPVEGCPMRHSAPCWKRDVKHVEAVQKQPCKSSRAKVCRGLYTPPMRIDATPRPARLCWWIVCILGVVGGTQSRAQWPGRWSPNRSATETRNHWRAIPRWRGDCRYMVCSHL